VYYGYNALTRHRCAIIKAAETLIKGYVRKPFWALL